MKNNSIVLKFVASIWIIFGHLRIHPFLSGIGFIGVGIFYFFSGYGLAYCTINRKDYLDDFFKKKFIRIFVPFYFMYLIYQVLIEYRGFNPTILWKFLYFNFGCNYHWYVKSILYIYITYYIFRKIMLRVNENSNRYILLGFLTWITSAMLVSGFENDPNRILPLAFIVGWIIATKQESINEFLKKNRYLILVELVALVLLYLNIYFSVFDGMTLFIVSNYTLPCLAGLLFYHMELIIKCENTKVINACTCSYEMYLVHPIIIQYCLRYCNIPKPIYVIIVFVGTYLGACLLRKLTNKIELKYITKQMSLPLKKVKLRVRRFTE
ncbi:MAG: acyltransferase [Lachnospiraceae bacterium]|nr:acyltransferase [Lachnospiraceae bacterium]